MRIKIIVVGEEDVNKLQRFLNQESEKGWHATNISFVHIKFEYDPKVRYYYNVASTLSSRTLIVDPEATEEDGKNITEPNYTIISNIKDIIVYRSLENQDLLTEERPDSPVAKKMFDRVIGRYIVTTLLVLSSIYLLLKGDLFSFLVSTPYQILIVILIFCLLRELTSLITLLSHRNKEFSDKLTMRWHPYLPDPIFIILGAMILYLISIVAPKVLISIALLIPFSLAFPLFKLIRKRRPETMRKIVVYTLSYILLTAVCFNVVGWANEAAKLQDTRVRESFLAKQTLDYHSFDLVESVEIKSETFSKLIIEEFLKKEELPTNLSPNTIHTVSNKFAYVKYLYFNQEKIILTTFEQPLEFYESFPNTIR